MKTGLYGILSRQEECMYVIVVYVPEGHLEAVKQAMFGAGAGSIGSYGECSWEVKGQGQFKPLDGSDPFLGETGQVSRVQEYRLEVTADEQHAAQAVQAMIEAHPYEVPAYHVYRGMNYRELQREES